MSGAFVMFMGGAGVVPSNFSGSVSSYDIGASASAILTMNSDGTFTLSGGGGDGVTGSVSNWFKPAVAGVGSAYYVRATVTSGTLSSGTTGAWTSLASAQTWSLTRSSLGISAATVLLEVSPFASGTPVVCSGSVGFDATWDSLV